MTARSNDGKLPWAAFHALSCTARHSRSRQYPVAAFFLPLPPLRARLDGGASGVKPGFPDRGRLSDPAPFPNERPRAKQGLGHGDSVEPLPVTGRFAPFKVDWGSCAQWPVGAGAGPDQGGDGQGQDRQ